MNRIKRSAEQSSTTVSSIGPFNKCNNERTDAWSVKEVGEDEENYDESAEDLQYANLHNLRMVE